MEHLNIKY